MQPWHITVASQGRTTLLVGPSAILRGVRAVTRVVGERLLLFSLVDDHLHLVVLTDEPGRVAAGVNRALRAAGAPPLQAAHLREVDGRNHLITLIGYLCRQPQKHGLADDPATYPGSCAPDLLGLRALPHFDAARIAQALPRVDVRAEVARSCGVAPTRLRAASDTELHELPTLALWHLACAAGGITGEERDYHAVALRRAFAGLVRAPRALPGTHGFGRRTLFTLRARPPDPRLLSAIRRRVSFYAIAIDHPTLTTA